MTDLPRIASFRQLDEHLKKTGVPRDEQMIRNNIYIAPLDWFAIEEGFNLRPIDPDHAEGFAKSYEQGLYVPPVVAELKIIDGNPRLVIREGHHRLTGARIADGRGANLPGLMVNEFKGNQSDAVVMMIKTSEGKELLPLERGEGEGNSTRSPTRLLRTFFPIQASRNGLDCGLKSSAWSTQAVAGDPKRAKHIHQQPEHRISFRSLSVYWHTTPQIGRAHV